MVAESFDLGALVEEFRDEARDQVDRLDAGLIRLEREGSLPEEGRSELLRALHTLKGNAGMLGLSAIRDFVHVLENVLKSSAERWPERMVERLFEGASALRRAAESAGTEDQEEAFRGLSLARHRLDEVERPAESTRSKAPEGDGGPGSATGVSLDRIRVRFENLDALLSEVGDLMGELSAVERALAEARAGRELRDRVESVHRRARGVRDRVMGMRLVPMARVLSRFHGLVRRLAREQGKEARLVVEGEGTEVDKSTADALSEPLLHLVRNAIDHGIQAPEVRERAGKPRHGTIRVTAAQEGDRVHVVVEDDGQGLDLLAIRRRAGEAGMLEEGTELPEDDLVELIFRSGFSTRRDVSTVSGRGVGLDVVRRSVRDLRGDVTVERPDRGGTRFLLRLPLTVALLPGLVLETGGEVLAIPATDVIRTMRLTAVERVGSGQMVRLDGALVPLIGLASLFGWGGEEPRGSFGVVVRSGRETAVIAADALLGQSDLLIKHLPPFGARAAAVSGASVRPGGRVILVLDVRQVMALKQGRQAGSAAA